MKKVSVLDVRQSYNSDKKRIDLVAHLWIYLVLRPISFYITPVFINKGISANTVTTLGLISLICGLNFILLGAISPLNFIIGAVLVNIWNLFDCIDGNIARFLSQSSKFGALFDFIVGLIYHTFLPLCLGMALYLARPNQLMLNLGLEIPKWCWLVAGAVQASTGLFRKVVSLQSRIDAPMQYKKQEKARISIWLILPRAILSFKAPLLLVASTADLLGLWLFGYAVYNLVSLVGMISLSLRRAKFEDR